MIHGSATVGQISEGPNVLGPNVRGIVWTPHGTAYTTGLHSKGEDRLTSFRYQ